MVSIITPIYNTPVLFLKQAIQSVELQKYNQKKIEVCLYNDGSDENHRYQYEKYLKRRSTKLEIKYSSDRKNRGPAYAKNMAVSMAEGKYIVLLDSDDVLHKDAIRMCVKSFKIYKKIEMVYSDNIKFEWPSLNLYQFRKKSYYQDLIEKYKMTTFDPVIQSSFIVGMHAFKRDTFQYLNGFDIKFRTGEDVELITRIYCLNKGNNFHHIPNVLYFRRHGKTSLSQRKQIDMWRTTERIFINTAKKMGLESTNVCYFDRIYPYLVSHYLLENKTKKLVPPYLDIKKKKLVGCKDDIKKLKSEGEIIINHDLRPILNMKTDN